MRKSQLKVTTSDANVGRRTLCLFIDESGQEDFGKGNSSYFALGGVAGSGPQIVRAQKAWRQMKVKHFGNANAMLHASGSIQTAEQIEAQSAFFSASRLMRFAFIMRRPPVMLPDANALHLLRPVMLEQLGELISSMPTLPSDVLVCFEHSERLMPKIIDAIPGLRIEMEGQQLPVVGLFTPKHAGEPMLEMADCVTWRAQRQFKEQEAGAAVMVEFEAVFPQGAQHAVYRELRLGSVSGGDDPRWKLLIDEAGQVKVWVGWGSAEPPKQ